MEDGVRPLLCLLAQVEHNGLRRPLQVEAAFARNYGGHCVEGNLQPKIAAEDDLGGFKQGFACKPFSAGFCTARNFAAHRVAVPGAKKNRPLRRRVAMGKTKPRPSCKRTGLCLARRFLRAMVWGRAVSGPVRVWLPVPVTQPPWP